MTHDYEGAAAPIPGKTYTRRAVLKRGLAAGAGTVALSASGGRFAAPGAAASGAPAQDAFLPKNKIVLPSAIAVKLTNHSVTLPLRQGMFNGQPVWYVVTESSDERIASDLGLNFAPAWRTSPPATRPSSRSPPRTRCWAGTRLRGQGDRGRAYRAYSVVQGSVTGRIGGTGSKPSPAVAIAPAT